MTMKPLQTDIEVGPFKYGGSGVVYLSRYTNNGKFSKVAVLVLDPETGERVLTVSANVPTLPLPVDHLLVKDYSENQGVLDVFVDAGLLEKTGDSHIIDYGTHKIELPICSFTGKLQEAYERFVEQNRESNTDQTEEDFPNV